MPQIEFGEWLPDQAQVATPGLRRVDNLFPTAGGWRAFPDLVPTELDPLDSACLGAFRGRTQGGSDFVAAGDVSKLYEGVGITLSDLSIGGGYALDSDEHWEFEVYGEYRFATCKSSPVQSSTGIGVQYGVLSADCSRASAMAIVGEFLVLGNIIGQGTPNSTIIGTQEAGVHWSAQGDPTSWPALATQTAVDLQSDFQILQGDAGPITDIIAAAEYAAVFRERQVWRMDYVGAPAFFAFRKLDDARGAIVPGTAIAVGNFVYFLSAEGFMVCNGSGTAPIGFEKVDRTILGGMDWDLATAHCSVAHYAALRSVVWSLPQIGVGPVTGGTRGGRTGRGAVPGTPSSGNSLFGYNYDLKQWWTVPKLNERVFNSPAYVSSESMDGVTYGVMDMDVNSPTGLGDVNMDTLGAGVSARDVLAVFDTTHQMSTFTADTYLTGLLWTGDFEMPDGRRALVRSVRPVFQGDTAAVEGAVNGRNLANDNIGPVITKPMVPSGVIPVRSSGRYQTAYFLSAGDLRDFQGFDYRIGRLGKR